MDVSYNRLFKLLIDEEVRKIEFARAAGASANTLAKLSRNDIVSMEIIIKIRRCLNCTADDIMEVLPEIRAK